MTLRMTLANAKTQGAMLATGMEHGMEPSHVRLETITLGKQIGQNGMVTHPCSHRRSKGN
jgi:hypothetical protein